MYKHLKSAYKHLKKMLNKEVKEGEKHIEDIVPEEPSLQTLRGRKKQVETSRLKSLEKNMQAKKAKRLKQHRHRSTPGEVEGQDAAPAMPHKEGKRWISNTTKKTRLNNKLATKKTLKRS